MSSPGKIKCTIGILTLNSEAGLPACLASLKDFSEIIVCDGNSTDRTREIAEAAGARVIKQYESSEPHLPCVKDKANVRQKNMEAATHEWYFFMDADDTLAPEVIEEIRAIVTKPKSEHLIYRMPTRIFFEQGQNLKEIKHEATYPSYQTRLVHRSVGAYFKGEVHDRLVYNEWKYPVGTMKGYYNFHWPEKRVQNFWAYLGRYADWELETARPSTFGNLLKWDIYRRLRTILGYVFYRLPWMYMRHGFRDCMPLNIELTIVRYHFKLLFKNIGKYIATRSWWIYVREISRGKDTNRTLTNLALAQTECVGSILDIGGGKGRASHYRFIRLNKWNKVTSLDIDPSTAPDIVLNLEEEKIPAKDESYDYVFLFNVLEHLNHRKEVLAEIRRVLKSVRSDGAVKKYADDSSGKLIGVIPFLVNVHPDPNDYVRLTEQGLRELFNEAGFSKVEIRAVVRGPFTAGYYQFEYLLPRIVRLVCGPFALLLDRIIMATINRNRRNLAAKFPLSYIFHVSK
jgi:glycosyltransferase involved in cell wall biosynthesis